MLTRFDCSGVKSVFFLLLRRMLFLLLLHFRRLSYRHHVFRRQWNSDYLEL